MPLRILSHERLSSRPVECPSWRRVPAPLGFVLSALVLCFACSSLALAGEEGTPFTPVRNPTASGPLRKNPANGRYFTDGSGKAIYLSGSHTWANMLDRGN